MTPPTMTGGLWVAFGRHVRFIFSQGVGWHAAAHEHRLGTPARGLVCHQRHRKRGGQLGHPASASPCRRDTAPTGTKSTSRRHAFCTSQPHLDSHAGTRISVSLSSGAIAVVREGTKQSSVARPRWESVCRTTHSADTPSGASAHETTCTQAAPAAPPPSPAPLTPSGFSGDGASSMMISSIRGFLHYLSHMQGAAYMEDRANHPLIVRSSIHPI